LLAVHVGTYWGEDWLEVVIFVVRDVRLEKSRYVETYIFRIGDIVKGVRPCDLDVVRSRNLSPRGCIFIVELGRCDRLLDQRIRLEGCLGQYREGREDSSGSQKYYSKPLELSD
jgi:hypothetical protein